MILNHYTTEKSAQNIAKKGFCCEEKRAFEKQNSYDEFWDSYCGNLRNGKEALHIDNAHFFILENDSFFEDIAGVNAKVSVDSKLLDITKLYVANMLHATRLYRAVQQRDIILVNLIKRQYWKDFIEFDYFVRNKSQINEICKRKYGMPYIAEILYFGDIKPEQLKIENYELKKIEDKCNKILIQFKV